MYTTNLRRTAKMFDTKICKCVWKLWKPDRCVYLSQKGEHGVFFREWYE